MPEKNDDMEFDCQDAVLRGMTIIDSRTELDHEERAKWLNASEAGTCIRKQWYRKHQPETAGRDERGYARRGQHGESYLVRALLAANVPLIHSGDDQINLQDPETGISGTPDGFILYDDVIIVPDFKTKDPRFNMANLPKRHNMLQVQINMELLIKTRPDLVEKREVRGLCIYMDASNYDDIVQYPVQRDPGVLESLKPRARKILKTKDVGRLDREGKTNGGKECRTECDFRDVCGVTEIEAAPRKRGNRGSKFEGVVRSYVEADEKERAGKEEKAKLKEGILSELKSRGQPSMTVGDFEVSTKTQQRSTFDKAGAFAAAEEKGLDLSTFDKPGATSVALTVKRAT